jgi:hypothetical protein
MLSETEEFVPSRVLLTLFQRDRIFGRDSYDSDGLDYVITLRQEHYVRQQQERTLKKGDRVAMLGRGIAVVKQADDQEALVMLSDRRVERIALKDIVFNQQNRRWEYDAPSYGRKNLNRT